MKNRHITSNDIKERIISLGFKIDTKNKKREIVQARQIAHYFAKKITYESLSSIGATIGGKDHATVLHSIRTVENLMNDKGFRQVFDTIEKHLIRVFRLKRNKSERIELLILELEARITGIELCRNSGVIEDYFIHRYRKRIELLNMIKNIK